MKKLSMFLMAVAMMGAFACNNQVQKSSADDEKACDGACDGKCCKEEQPAPKKEKKTIVCRVVVKDGQEAAFTDVAKKLVDATRQEPGNVSYNLYQCPFDSKSFIFYEEYKDDEAFNAHAASDHFKAFAGAIKDMLAEDLKIEQF